VKRYRIVERTLGSFTIEYKGLFMWRCGDYQGAMGCRWPRRFSTLKDAKARLAEILAHEAHRPRVVCEPKDYPI